MTATNHDQFEILVEFMELNEGIAKHFLNSFQFRNTTNQLWNEVKEKLNAAGPPQKNVEGWKKVWRDFKYNTKGKLRSNKRSISGTGGGPCRIKRLTNLEERTCVLLDLRGEIEGIKVKKIGCGIQSTTESCINNIPSTSVINAASSFDLSPYNIATITEHNTSNLEIIDLYSEIEIPEITQESTAAPDTHRNRPQRGPKKTKITAKNLLQKQIQMQEKFYKKQEAFAEKKQSQTREIIKTLKDIRNIEEKKLSLKIKKLNFEEAKWKAKQNIDLDKMKQKAEMLQIKGKQLELRRLEWEAHQ